MNLPSAAKKPKDTEYRWLKVARLVRPYAGESYLNVNWFLAEPSGPLDDPWRDFLTMGNEKDFPWSSDSRVVCKVGRKIKVPTS